MTSGTLQRDETSTGVHPPLAGQTALVTGAASGIGAGVARAHPRLRRRAKVRVSLQRTARPPTAA